MATLTEPGYVALNRARKVIALVEAARTLGLTFADVARLDDAGKQAVEERAEVRRGSDLTWLMVRSMMAGSVSARCPWCGHGDREGAPGPALSYGHDGACRR